MTCSFLYHTINSNQKIIFKIFVLLIHLNENRVRIEWISCESCVKINVRRNDRD